MLAAILSPPLTTGPVSVELHTGSTDTVREWSALIAEVLAGKPHACPFCGIPEPAEWKVVDRERLSDKRTVEVTCTACWAIFIAVEVADGAWVVS